MTQPIDYVEALDKLKFYLTRMIADDFDRYEEENNINIYEKNKTLFDGTYFIHYLLMYNIAYKNYMFIYNHISEEDLINLIEKNDLGKYYFNVRKVNYGSVFVSTLKNHYFQTFGVKIKNLKDKIIEAKLNLNHLE